MLLGFRASIRRIFAGGQQRRGVRFLRYLDWQRRRLLGRFPFEQRISRSRIIAPTRGSGVSALIHIHGLYDRNNMGLIQELLSDGGTFFDVGANIGSYTLIASEQPEARVVAFEPHPATFAELQRNVELNRRENVTLYCMALGERDGEVRLTDDAGSTENQVVEPGAGATISVPVARAESVCRTHGAPKLIKVDVEGFEYPVIRGLGSFLADVEALFVESTMPGTQERLPPYLQRHGFRGPFRVDLDGRVLLASEGGVEDEVWISRTFMPRLTQELGFTEA